MMQVVQVEIIEAKTIRELNSLINSFLIGIPADRYIDCKIGKGDFHTAMIIYKN